MLDTINHLIDSNAAACVFWLFVVAVVALQCIPVCINRNDRNK